MFSARFDDGGDHANNVVNEVAISAHVGTLVEEVYDRVAKCFSTIGRTGIPSSLVVGIPLQFGGVETTLQ